jgi:hypothetical protein
MLFLSVRRFFDYAGPPDHSRLAQPAVLPSLYHYEVSTLIRVFRSSIARPTDTPVYASADASRRRP